MRRGHSMDVVLTLLLLGLFTGSVLMVLVLGAQSYQKVTVSIQESYKERTCLQYIATKLNHYSGDRTVAVTVFGDGSALALYETIDQCDYVTYLYHHDGQAMELFCEADAALTPNAGFSIMAVEDFTIEVVGDNLLHLTCTGNGSTAQLYVDVQLREEGAP